MSPSAWSASPLATRRRSAPEVERVVLEVEDARRSLPLAAGAARARTSVSMPRTSAKSVKSMVGLGRPRGATLAFACGCGNGCNCGCCVKGEAGGGCGDAGAPKDWRNSRVPQAEEPKLRLARWALSDLDSPERQRWNQTGTATLACLEL